LDGACSIYEGEERRINGFCGENLRERDQLEDPDVDETILLIYFFRNWDVRAWTGLV
jgi:hypothetical protein